MPEAVIHPTPAELTAFGLGKLPEHAADAVAAHLEKCPNCRRVVADVSPDSFLVRVRAAGPAGSSFPPSLAQPGKADQPAIAHVPAPDIPPELARHPKYLILRELNRGGMGVVYQARHKEMNRPIVIKVIRRSLLDQPGALERFRREIQAAAQLSHPNIVIAYDAEQAGEVHLLVMEFVPGQSLAEVLEKKGPLPVDKACHYMSQAAVGLHHAYKRNMVHRDIKPSNLMLTPQGQVKILDFGLAKIIRESGTRTGITASDTYMGTPEYSAPEQATDARTADIRADIYSLGCTLYCLLAGRPPFREETAMKTVLAHLQQQPQPLTELRPDVPERLWRAVARMLAKEPKQRYQKPKEVVLALAPFIKPGLKVGPVPAPDVGSPIKGTVIETESEIEKVVRAAPRPTRPKKAQARDETSPPANWTDETVPPNEGARFDDEATPPRPTWWKRPGVLAGAFGASLALIVMTIIIIAANRQKQNDNPNKTRAFNKIASAPEQPKLQNNADDIEVPLPKPERKPRKPKQEEEPPKKRSDPELPKVADKREEQPAAPHVAAPRPSAATPKVENKELPANPISPEAKKNEAEPKRDGLTQRAKRIGRWEIQHKVNNSSEYVAQLRELGAILAIPVREGPSGAEYRIIRDLLARPAKLIKEEMQEIQRKEYWKNPEPSSVRGVMTILGLNMRPSHFLAITTKEVEQKLLRLELDYLKQRHPGRSEDDIVSTTFKFKTGDGKYVLEVVEQKLK